MPKRVAVTQRSPVRAGMVADLGPGDLVWVTRDATKRPDWAAINQALGTAFARGAEIHMVSEGKK